MGRALIALHALHVRFTIWNISFSFSIWQQREMFIFDVWVNTNSTFSDNASLSICSAGAKDINAKMLHSFLSNTLVWSRNYYRKAKLYSRIDFTSKALSLFEVFLNNSIIFVSDYARYYLVVSSFFLAPLWRKIIAVTSAQEGRPHIARFAQRTINSNKQNNANKRNYA